MDRYLPIGYELHLDGRVGKYIITNIIGKGASTVAYCADYYCDDGNCSKHIIKEFNPNYISFQRTENGEMQFNISDKNRVIYAKERFLSGCHNQIKIRNQIATMNQTPPIEGPFYANDTIYTDVIAYNGTTYDVAYKNLSLCDRMKVCLSVAKLVKCYHDAGYLCLDIKPENIFVIPETKELLYFIDFDSVCTKGDIVFGNSISYTKQWAAPEQLNPYDMDEISEATDIYAVGELVFWSVFERHSTIEEHRGFSVYPFEDIRPHVSTILGKLFHNTLRSSVSSRFKSINIVIELLNDVIEEQSKKEYIITSAIRPKDFFIGREKELAEISQRLNEEKLIFLYGIGGIGKSEIAKQYATLNSVKYNNILYWRYNGDLESAICQDDFVAISDLHRDKDESDAGYCKRKLKAIQSCLKGKNLIIIDNFDCILEDITYIQTWNKILSLNCEILVTTRVKQDEHLFKIKRIEDFNILRQIFIKNSDICFYDEKHLEYIDKIITFGECNTLFIELVAKQIFASAISPKEMYELLCKEGVYGSGEEKICINKDGHSSSDNIFNIIKKVFSTATLSYDRLLLLVKAAFLPENGVSIKEFGIYYNIENKDDINWLVSNGWITRSADEEAVLSVHPLIIEVVLDEFKNNYRLQEEFFEDAIRFFESEINNINQRTHLQMSSAIAMAIKKNKISVQMASIYIIRYVDYYSEYGNTYNKGELLEYAIDILENNEYCFIEYAYLIYIPYYCMRNSFISTIKECRSHLKKAKKYKNDYINARYHSTLAKLLAEYNGDINIAINYKCFLNIYTKLFYSLSSLYHLFISLIYFLRIGIYFKRTNKVPPNIKALLNNLRYLSPKENDINHLVIFLREIAEYLEIIDSKTVLHIYNSRLEREFLNEAIEIRKLISAIIESTTYDNFENFIQIENDKARLLCIKYKYKEAQMSLKNNINLIDCNNRIPGISLFKTHMLICEIAAINGDYNTAILQIKKCLEITTELHFPEDLSLKLQLGRYLNEVKATDESEEINTYVLKLLKEMDNNSHKLYLGDALYNMATLQNLKCNYDQALIEYEEVIREYKKCKPRKWQLQLVEARCYRKMYEIYLMQEKNVEAKKCYKKSKKCYYKSLGKKHPEVISFLKRHSN